MAELEIAATVSGIDFVADDGDKTHAVVKIQIVNMTHSYDVSLGFEISDVTTSDEAVERAHILLKDFAKGLVVACERPLLLGKFDL